MSPTEYGRQLASQHTAERPLTEDQADAAARILAVSLSEQEDAA